MDSHTKSYKSPDPVVPIQSLYICINRAVNTNCKLELSVHRLARPSLEDRIL